VNDYSNRRRYIMYIYQFMNSIIIYYIQKSKQCIKLFIFQFTYNYYEVYNNNSITQKFIFNYAKYFELCFRISSGEYWT